MRCRKVFIVQIFILSICLLTACRNKNGGDFVTETETMEEWFAEHTEESTETVKYEEIPETIKEAQADKVTAEETVMETVKEELTDQEFSWSDRALAECLNKKPEDLTMEDYLSVTALYIYGGKRTYNRDENGVYFSIDGKSVAEPFTEVPTNINIEDIAMYRNLQSLDIELNFDQHSGTYIRHYEMLSQFSQMRRLTILLNDLSSIYGTDIADSIADLSFIRKMPDLCFLHLENIDLPIDLSPIFEHKIEHVLLPACGITEDSFWGMDETADWPTVFQLWCNQISDATVLTTAQKPDGSGIQQLSLSWNPLVTLGACVTYEELSAAKAWAEIILSLEDTDFEEYSVYWNHD